MIILLGLIANLIGTLILAFAMGAYYKWINFSLDAHETFIASVSNGGDVFAITGTDIHRSHTYKSANIWMMIGAFLIVIGFAMQLFVVKDQLRKDVVQPSSPPYSETTMQLPIR